MAGTAIYSPQLGTDIDSGLSNLGSLFTPPTAQQLQVKGNLANQQATNDRINQGLSGLQGVNPTIADLFRVGDSDPTGHYTKMNQYQNSQSDTPNLLKLDLGNIAINGVAGNSFLGRSQDKLGENEVTNPSPILGALGIKPSRGIVDVGDGNKILPNGSTLSAPDDGKPDLDAQRQQTILNAVLGLPPDQQKMWALRQSWNGGAPGTVVNTGGDGGADAAIEKAYGGKVGDTIAADVQKGVDAGKTMQDTATMRSAIQAGGDNITFGPFANQVLAIKKAGGSILGHDLPGVPESDVVNNVGYGLATAAAKAISARPSQAEFARAMETKPGLSMSKTGSIASLNIMDQHAKSDQDLASMASDTTPVQTASGTTTQGALNRGNWPAVKAQYYASHPIMSPFNTGKPFGADDINTLTQAASAAGIPGMSAPQSSSVAIGPGGGTQNAPGVGTSITSPGAAQAAGGAASASKVIGGVTYTKGADGNWYAGQ